MPWWSERVTTHYPPSTVFSGNDPITDSEYLRFARIILTEGIPFGLASLPMAFEFGRGKAAAEMQVDPKQISATGSGRIGYSMSPTSFGRPYDSARSDFDLFLIDRPIFDALAGEYRAFIARVEAADIPAAFSDRMPEWLANKPAVESTIRRRFINQKFIPNWRPFPTTKTVAQGAFLFRDHVNKVVGRDVVGRTSFRVYADWDAAIEQIGFSLRGSVQKWRAAQAAVAPAVH